MADEQNNRGAFLIQEFYCAKMDAPIYARICAVIAKGLTRDSRVGAAILDWPGEPTRDALPLRFIGGLHALVLAGADDELAAVFSGAISDPAEVEAALLRVLLRHDDALLPWLDGPPQTNEPGRSGGLMLGLLEIARRHGPKIEILEIGSSAGLNLLIDRYRIDLGGTWVGPEGSPVTLVPEWSGPAPEAVPIEIVSTHGCDVHPMDATDPAVERRLAAYVWAEIPARAVRLRAAIGMMREEGVALDHADAADWVEARLAEPQAAGVTRVLMHSVVWQYLPEAVAERVRAAMKAAGARATAERPLGWVAMEPDRSAGEILIRARSWPDSPDWTMLASAHAHAAWIDTAPVAAAERVDLPEAAKVSI